MFGPSHFRYVPPVSRAPDSELVLQRGGLPSEIALPRVQNCVSRGRCGLRKTEKIFSANNEQSIMKHGEKWFSEKL